MEGEGGSYPCVGGENTRHLWAPSPCWRGEIGGEGEGRNEDSVCGRTTRALLEGERVGGAACGDWAGGGDRVASAARDGPAGRPDGAPWQRLQRSKRSLFGCSFVENNTGYALETTMGLLQEPPVVGYIVASERTV